MSRPVSYTSAVTVNIASYSGNDSYVTTGTSYPVSNGINSSANTSNYAAISATSTSSGFAYYSFASMSIPSIATITSVSCTVRTRASATSSGTSSFQLFAGSTAKGSQTTVTSTTVTTYNLTSGTSWTAQEVNNGISLRIGVRRSSTQRAYSNRFYGATLRINYSVSGTEYEITASSTYTGATVSPASQYIFSGNSGTVRLDVYDISEVTVEDNGVDVTDSFVTKLNVSSGITTLSPTGFTTGLSSSNANFYMSSNQTGITRLQYPIGYTAENPNPTGDTSYTYVKDNNQNTATGWINYKFNFSDIPANATIKSVRVSAYGARESTQTSAQYKAVLAAYYGDTLKGASEEFASTSNTIFTLTNVGSWTRAELNDAQVRFTVAYYGGRIFGVTFEVEWETPATNPYYYEYTLTNVNADHTIVVKETVIIPPEEDPDKTYYSLTISSINSITDPRRGTTRIESGSGQTITITPDDPQLTLATDNGVDITSQLVSHGTPPSSSITTAQGASYGFVYCASTEYYTSQNKGVSNSAAVARVSFNLPVRCLITIEFINYAEATYDYGIFGNLDTALGTTYTSDTNAKLVCNTSTYNVSTPQTITYEVPSGSHFIDIKYRKDQATDSYNDNLQFKVAQIEELEPNIYYTYTLQNISDNHSLIFIFGNVTYYFINSSTDSNAKLYPDGQMVELQGGEYKLTIVPENTGDTITLKDNNVDVTGSLVKKEEQVQKDGQTITVVNYIYTLNNVQTGHTLLVSSTQTTISYVKVGGSWVPLTAIYKKVDGRWQQQEPSLDLFDEDTIYFKGN